MKRKSVSFADRVYRVVSRIPPGRVSTYAEVARALKCRAYRAVGSALHRNPYAPQVPCHRVVMSSGMLGGFAHGAERKMALLAGEGIPVQGGKIQDFDQFFFPLKQLH